MNWSPCFVPAGDKRHVMVVLNIDRTCRRGSFASIDHGRGVVMAI